MAEELKTHTADAMKIDTAPWAKAYAEVDMNKLYTELTLENVENEPLVTQQKRIEDYKQLFQEESPESSGQNKSKDVQRKTNMTRKRKKGKKVLFKGNPGMGKTILMKKIGWDWAKGFFTTFSIVFFVFLKLVEPGEAIENIIVSHTPALEGMSITPKKLRQILDQFSEKCLLILDGLDEHALGQNEDVLKIIRGQNLLYCSIIVTSRPHSTKGIERYFNTIVNVEGFNRSHAEEFAAKILTDRRKINSVLQFSPSEWEYLYVCPIIFLIMCVLVKEDQIFLESRNFCNGELYFRLVRFLYVKYTTQKGIECERKHLEELLKKMGKLAWETLKSGNGLLRRSHVIKEIGEEAFEYGLLIGNEDFRLVGHEIADILVTFPHRTLQEFLGSYYFVLELSEGCSVESLLGSDCERARFMQDQLFLHFCLWFANGNEDLIPITHGKIVLQSLKSYIVDRIDVVQFEPEVTGRIFPACDLNLGQNRGDTLVLSFLREVFTGLTQVRHLMLLAHDSIEWILDSVGPENLKYLSSIVIEDMNCATVMPWMKSDGDSKAEATKMTWLQYVISQPSDGSLNIVIGGKDCTDIFNRIMKYFRNLDRSLSAVYLFVVQSDTLELSSFMDAKVKKLVITNYIHCHIACVNEISSCPLLTDLCLINFHNIDLVDGIRDSVMSALSRAAQTGNIPNLTHLSFEDSRYGLSFQNCHYTYFIIIP